MSLGRMVGKLANVSRCNDTTNMGSLCNDTPVIGRSKVMSNKKHVEETTPHPTLHLKVVGSIPPYTLTVGRNIAMGK